MKYILTDGLHLVFSHSVVTHHPNAAERRPTAPVLHPSQSVKTKRSRNGPDKNVFENVLLCQ